MCRKRDELEFSCAMMRLMFNGPKLSQDGLFFSIKSNPYDLHISACHGGKIPTSIQYLPFRTILRLQAHVYDSHLRTQAAWCPKIRIIWTTKQVDSNDNFVKKRNGVCSKKSTALHKPYLTLLCAKSREYLCLVTLFSHCNFEFNTSREALGMIVVL